MSPCGKLAAVAFVMQERNAESAGIGNAGNLNQNDCSRSFVLGKASCETGKLRLFWLDHSPLPVQAKNLRRSLKSAEHQHDSAVFFQMGHRFNPAAGQVQIGNGLRAQDPKRIESLRRYVDVATRIERRRPYKENRLRFDKFPDGIVDRRINFPHGETLLAPIVASPSAESQLKGQALAFRRSETSRKTRRSSARPRKNSYFVGSQ